MAVAKNKRKFSTVLHRVVENYRMRLFHVHLASFIFILYSTFYILQPNFAYASEYVLPYPSYMPGHKLYKIHQILEEAQEYWYFGNIAKFKYHIKMSDKYLVEAKTLFEYKQYLLASRALKNSDKHFRRARMYLAKAEKEGKDLSNKDAEIKAAGKKHTEILLELNDKLMPNVVWKEENQKPINLNIASRLQQAITIRDRLEDKKN